jgi:hypothetical protein
MFLLTRMKICACVRLRMYVRAYACVCKYVRACVYLCILLDSIQMLIVSVHQYLNRTYGEGPFVDRLGLKQNSNQMCMKIKHLQIIRLTIIHLKCICLQIIHLKIIHLKLSGNHKCLAASSPSSVETNVRQLTSPDRFPRILRQSCHLPKATPHQKKHPYLSETTNAPNHCDLQVLPNQHSSPRALASC